MPKSQVTVRCPINIALIKYWAKRDDTLVLPFADSISVSLSSSVLGSTTTLIVDTQFSSTTFWLNGKQEPVTNRMMACINKAHEFAKKMNMSLFLKENTLLPPLEEIQYKIISWNDFPTASGLASSASGLASLAYALVQLHQLDTCYSLTELSIIARLGSGSAIRSIFGGFVEWKAGENPDGSDSVSLPLLSKEDWPSIQFLVLVCSESTKWVSSTEGMSLSVSTSEFSSFRLKHLLPLRLSALRNAIDKKDFGSLAKITIQDSNSFHAVCMDTCPPLLYLNDFSKFIIHWVSMYNKVWTEKHTCLNSTTIPNTRSLSSPLLGSECVKKVAYTFDAGPHPVLMFETEKNTLHFIYFLKKWIPFDASIIKTYNDSFLDALDGYVDESDPSFLSCLQANIKTPMHSLSSERFLSHIYHCTLDEGPRLLERTNS